MNNSDKELDTLRRMEREFQTIQLTQLPTRLLSETFPSSKKLPNMLELLLELLMRISYFWLKELWLVVVFHLLVESKLLMPELLRLLKLVLLWVLVALLQKKMLILLSRIMTLLQFTILSCGEEPSMKTAENSFNSN